VGGGGLFELTFANGQIVGWHNLASDPYRLRNLVQGTSLGPDLLAITEEGAPQELEESGGAVLVRPQLIEMTPVRIVLASEWRHSHDQKGSLEEPPFRRWVYTVYPSGQIYAAVECAAPTLPAASSGQTGLAVTIAAPDDQNVQTVLHGPAGETDAPVAYATVRDGSGFAFLLYVPAQESGSPLRMLEQPDEDRRRLSLLAVRPGEPRAEGPWYCHLLLAPADLVGDEEAEVRAMGFQHPSALDLQLGSLADRAGPTSDLNGFDRESGSYVIRPDRGRVRLTIDGTTRPVFSPAFRIINSDERPAQVYVDHIVLDATAVTPAGDLIFQIPRTIRERAVVEVFFRRS